MSADEIELILKERDDKTYISIYKLMVSLYLFKVPIFCVGGGDSNKGKSKKWRKILQFPHISQCIGLKDKLGKSNNNSKLKKWFFNFN